jgi:anti-sigma regulatory factor (Ser/Thr protein kinase)
MDVHLKFLVPSHPRFLCVVRAAVEELGLVYGLPEEDCRAITLAVDEALANVIRHAYHGKSDRAIEVNCHASAERLEFTLLDQGEAPDPARICGQPMDDVALSGRGTHIMKMVMDDVCYERVPEGNQVRLTKRLTGAKDGAKGERRDI